MPTPDSSHSVCPRQVAVAVLHDVHQCEIVLQKGNRQRGKRSDETDRMQIDSSTVQSNRPQRRQASCRLIQGTYKRQDERKMPQLTKHAGPTVSMDAAVPHKRHISTIQTTH